MQPVVPAPAPTGVLQGTIIGLGALRPVVLQNNDDVAGARSFLNTFGQNSSVFSFDSVPVGSQYRITVKVQPFAKICTVANGSGIVGAPDAAPITVTCVNDSAVARYCVGGTISQSVHDAPAAQLMLTTEEGTRVRTTAGLPVGSPSCWFPDSVFDSLGNLPVFAYTVTATFTDASGNVNICAVTNGTNPVAGSGPDAVPLPPSADVMDVAATACSFTVTAAVALNAGAPAQPLGDGLTLALREPRTGIDTQTVDVATFETVSFPDVYSNADAIYELVVTHQPYGQTCVVGGRSQLQWGGAVLLLNPVDTASGWMIDRKVRCNPDPGPASQLTGTYQLTTVATEGTASVTTTTRNFLTFFDDGTFLYGLHAPGVSSGSTGGGASTASGVQHGFYAYDPAAGTLMLTPLTDTVTGINSTRLSSAGATRTLTEVVKSSGPSGQISARFNPTVDWILTEPRSVEGQMPGTWATADHRRVWVFDGSTYAGFHAGVNGLANAEDACFSIDPSTPQAGYFTRRGNATTCQLLDGPPSTTLMYTLEVPNLVTTPRAPEGFIGHWPQSGSNADGRPSSPVHFSIDPGTPDRLTVQDTSTDGTPRYPPIVLFRTGAN